jgi:hypothetical protein
MNNERLLLNYDPDGSLLIHIYYYFSINSPNELIKIHNEM